MGCLPGSGGLTWTARPTFEEIHSVPHGSPCVNVLLAKVPRAFVCGAWGVSRGVGRGLGLEEAHLAPAQGLWVLPEISC